MNVKECDAHFLQMYIQGCGHDVLPYNSVLVRTSISGISIKNTLITVMPEFLLSDSIILSSGPHCGEGCGDCKYTRSRQILHKADSV